jgi:hypothetical protein
LAPPYRSPKLSSHVVPAAFREQMRSEALIHMGLGPAAATYGFQSLHRPVDEQDDLDRDWAAVTFANSASSTTAPQLSNDDAQRTRRHLAWLVQHFIAAGGRTLNEEELQPASKWSSHAFERHVSPHVFKQYEEELRQLVRLSPAGNPAASDENKAVAR